MRRWLTSQSSVQPADLDDVAKEVFERLSRYSDDALAECPQSFVLRIAANVVDEWRDGLGSHADTSAGAGCTQNHLTTPELAARLRSAVDQLPPRQHQVLLLHINQDLTYKQIAAALDLTPRVVRRDLARAYAYLRNACGSTDLDAAFTL